MLLGARVTEDNGKLRALPFPFLRNECRLRGSGYQKQWVPGKSLKKGKLQNTYRELHAFPPTFLPDYLHPFSIQEGYRPGKLCIQKQ